MVNILEGVNLGFPDGAYGNVVAILYILCGLGIFLFGINMMGSSLKAMAGDKMKVIIAKGTNTPIKGMLVGFVTTMLTQSASGTSALAVSLVGAGLMTFGQALGVLLGANDAYYGLEKWGHTTFIINSGISDWAIKFKTCAVSEYTVIDVKKGK